MKKRESQLLRQLVRALVTEAATSGAQAIKHGLALYRGPDQDGTVYVLYDTAVAQRLAQSTGGFAKPIPESELDKLFAGFVWGIQHSDDANGAFEIRLSAARKGFGPLMYDIVMSDAPDGIMSDHYHSSSPSERNLWKKYFSDRGDVEHSPLDDVDDPKTPPHSDDAQLVDDPNAPYLDYSYDGAGDSQSRAKLLAKHSELAKWLKDRAVPSRAFESVLASRAEDYFASKYVPS